MVRGRPATILKVLAILGPWLLIYWQDLEVVAGDAINSEVMNYIIVIPFFIGYAIYRKRRVLQAVTPLENSRQIRNVETGVGASLLLTSFILYWHGSYTFYPVEYHLLSMFIFLAGAILMVYNWQTLRQLLFPLALILFLEPVPLQVANMIGFQISAISSIAAYNLLKFFGLPVELTIQQTPIIMVQTVQGVEIPLAIDVACSGLYSMTGFATFAVFASFITRGATWKRIALFALGFPMIYGLNILRIATIVWIAHGWGEGAAIQAFHLLGGSVLIFAATLLLLTLGDKVGKLRIFTTRVNQEPCTLCNESLTKGESFCPYCGSFLKPQKQSIAGNNMVRIIGVILIALLIIPIQIPPFALAKGTASIDLGTFSPSEIKNDILPTIPGWDLEFLYRDVEVEKAAHWDAALVYYYQKQGPDEFQPIVFVLIQIEKGRHTWEASLYVWPAKYGYPTATMLVERDVDILDSPRIAGRFLEFIRVRSTVPEAVVYWFEEAQFTVNETIVSRYVSISLDAYPEDLARAGLIEGPNDADGIQAILLPMARSIAEHWEPLKTWTLIQMGINQWTGYLLIGTISPCIVAVSFLCFKLRTDRKRNAELFKRLIVPLEREVLEAVALSSRKGPPTGRAIDAKYLENTGKEIEPEKLIEKLEAAKEVGLVKREISNNDDEPVLVWKNRF